MRNTAMDVNKVGIAVLVLLILILMAFTPSMSRIGVATCIAGLQRKAYEVCESFVSDEVSKKWLLNEVDKIGE